MLERLAVEVGLDRDETLQLLGGDAYGSAVRADEQRASELGIDAVPFFVVDGRYGVPGAQDARRLGQLLDRAWLDHRGAAERTGT